MLPGPRLYVCGHRIHHGAAGALLALIGGLLCWHDRRDFPWPFHDRS